MTSLAGFDHEVSVFRKADPSSRLPLNGHSVHLWMVNLDQMLDLVQTGHLPDHRQWLTDKEVARGMRFRFEIDRRRFFCIRTILRWMLGKYLRIAPQDVKFSIGRFGKPSLVGWPLQFNVSHSGPRSLIGISSDTALGVDIEAIRPIQQIEDLATLVFGRDHLDQFLALPAKHRLIAFYNAWTRKEALVKATGEGLSKKLNDSDFAVWQMFDAAGVDDGFSTNAKWTLQTLRPAPGYAASLAVAQVGIDVQLFQLDSLNGNAQARSDSGVSLFEKV